MNLKGRVFFLSKQEICEQSDVAIDIQNLIATIYIWRDTFEVIAYLLLLHVTYTHSAALLLTINCCCTLISRKYLF